MGEVMKELLIFVAGLSAGACFSLMLVSFLIISKNSDELVKASHKDGTFDVHV